MRAPALRGLPDATAVRPGAEPVTSWFEFWPGWAFYAPVILQWIALGVRYGDLSLPTAANPHIDTGGLCGESKAAILDQVAAPARAWIAPYIRLGSVDIDAAERAMARAGLAYPVVAKPDIGCNGAGVRLVPDRATLAATLPLFPRGAAVLLQHFVPLEGEAGLFYVRHPSEAHGRVTSITLKESPVLVGDGRSTLDDLLWAEPRARRARHQYLPRLAGRLEAVPASGERVRLVFVGNHCKGSMFRDGHALLTEALEARVEALARALPDFHFGRFDVRFDTVASLRAGEFTVIELNGVGAEATHVWDARMRLRQAWADQLRHSRAAFEIGRVNRARGFRSSGLLGMARHWRHQRALMRAYPLPD